MRWTGIFVVAALASSPLQAQPPSKVDADFFLKQVRPLLEKHCFSCHSHAANKAKGHLVVDSRGAVLKGGESGPAIDLQKPTQSLFLKAIGYEDDELRMPPKGKLPAADLAILADWVKRGVPWSGEETKAASTGHVPGQISEADRKWWAYQPVKAVAPPMVKDAAWNANPIDAFLRHRLDKEGLVPAPPAERATLIRRVTYDLTGLPPTPEEIQSFVSDSDPRAFEKLVDRLLASPRYGERMARRWLDLVRYAESDGFRLDGYRPSAWRYRDYVIRAFNRDKPYDRFIREQIAGDEASPGDADALVATGFLAAGIYEYNQRDVRTQHGDMLNEMTDTAADVFLAQGLGCARCHDHKFDPILQKDYFRMRAFFEPTVILQEEPYATPEERKVHEAKRKEWEAATKDVRAKIFAIEEPERRAMEQSMVSKFPKDIQEFFKKNPSKRSPYEQQIVALAYRQVSYEFDKIDGRIKGEAKDRLLDLRRELAKFDKIKPASLPRAHLARDVGPVAPPTPAPKKGLDIAPGFFTIFDEGLASVTPTATSTGRRLALANWIASPENPLTSRVMVNRLWQYHFGRGLVATTSDFGKLGELPSHPELLDWLALRFVNDGWSIKKMQRLMVTSAAYRQSSLAPASEVALKKDPENRLLWRATTRRLDAEQIRDTLLRTSDKLDLAEGGPSVEAREPRRSVYTKVQRNFRDPLLDVFDWPEGFSSTAERNVTTTATQALLLLNSALMQQQARALADRVKKEKFEGEAAVDRVFQLVYGRAPRADERKLALAFLTEQPGRLKPDVKASAGIEFAKLPLREGRAVVFTPGARPVRMTAPDPDKVPRGDFTVEAHVLLRSTFEDGTVRTIASFWDGDPKSPGGWSLGVTSKKSAYKPQVLVLQLWGKTREGKPHYEPVFSSLNLALNKPYFVAVSARLGDAGESGITFYAKDLTNDEEPVQIYQTSHKVVKLMPAKGRFTIGGADSLANERAWDGLIDDVRLSNAVLDQDQLLLTSESSRDDTVGFWMFEKTPGALKDSSSNQFHLIQPGASVQAAVPADSRFTALIDLCLTLLNTNEFLYVD